MCCSGYPRYNCCYHWGGSWNSCSLIFLAYKAILTTTKASLGARNQRGLEELKFSSYSNLVKEILATPITYSYRAPKLALIIWAAAGSGSGTHVLSLYIHTVVHVVHVSKKSCNQHCNGCLFCIRNYSCF